jgi:hypothetical protein
VTDAFSSEFTDTGDAQFMIIKPYITVTAPNGGESWSAGKSYTITWVSDGVTSVTIEYSANGGLNWIQIATNVSAVSGAYSWRPPAQQVLHMIVRVRDMDNETVWDMSDGDIILSVNEEAPGEFSVSPNHPNPFNPSTAISFTLPRAEMVRVDIFNASGQKVGCAFDGRMERGRRTVVWNAGNLSAGLYFARVHEGREQRIIKMLLVK